MTSSDVDAIALLGRITRVRLDGTRRTAAAARERADAARDAHARAAEALVRERGHVPGTVALLVGAAAWLAQAQGRAVLLAHEAAGCAEVADSTMDEARAVFLEMKRCELIIERRLRARAREAQREIERGVDDLVAARGGRPLRTPVPA